jgi:hypothetical protein
LKEGLELDVSMGDFKIHIFKVNISPTPLQRGALKNCFLTAISVDSTIQKNQQ